MWVSSINRPVVVYALTLFISSGWEIKAFNATPAYTHIVVKAIRVCHKFMANIHS